jgi:hypothetical protein
MYFDPYSRIQIRNSEYIFRRYLCCMSSSEHSWLEKGKRITLTVAEWRDYLSFSSGNNGACDHLKIGLSNLARREACGENTLRRVGFGYEMHREMVSAEEDEQYGEMKAALDLLLLYNSAAFQPCEDPHTATASTIICLSLSEKSLLR